MSTATCSSKSKVCHCGHLMPRSRASHRLAPGGPVTCFHGCASKICFLQAFCCSLTHLPSQTPSAQVSVATAESSSSTSKAITFMEKVRATRCFISYCCCHLPPQLEPICRRDGHSLSSPRSRGNQARSQQLSHPNPHVFFWKIRFS